MMRPGNGLGPLIPFSPLLARVGFPLRGVLVYRLKRQHVQSTSTLISAWGESGGVKIAGNRDRCVKISYFRSGARWPAMLHF